MNGQWKTLIAVAFLSVFLGGCQSVECWKPGWFRGLGTKSCRHVGSTRLCSHCSRCSCSYSKAVPPGCGQICCVKIPGEPVSLGAPEAHSPTAPVRGQPVHRRGKRLQLPAPEDAQTPKPHLTIAELPAPPDIKSLRLNNARGSQRPSQVATFGAIASSQHPRRPNAAIGEISQADETPSRTPDAAELESRIRKLWKQLPLVPVKDNVIQTPIAKKVDNSDPPVVQILVAKSEPKVQRLVLAPETLPEPRAEKTAYCRDEHFGWVQGVVQRTSKGVRLRYASIEKLDKYGGSVTLVGGNDTALRDGAHVRIYGRLVNPIGSKFAPLYQVESVGAIPE